MIDMGKSNINDNNGKVVVGSNNNVIELVNVVININLDEMLLIDKLIINQIRKNIIELNNNIQFIVDDATQLKK
jgi:hypothetical protein